MAIFSPSPTFPKPLPIPTQSSSPLPFSIHSLRLSLPPSPLSTGPAPRLSRCHSALSPQPPPQSDPPPGKDPQVFMMENSLWPKRFCLIDKVVKTSGLDSVEVCGLELKNVGASCAIDEEIGALLCH
ncbi:hypothetical protein DKX38_001455 [Salix brachista]|uniref:Uncharacterized protein n=1 Tax=Salix brachista TaxID=2182728 RepID=A0A5N5P697_9ROSI|nr:hypothetical protein DKX38_001455 [Salix brachista]